MWRPSKTISPYILDLSLRIVFAWLLSKSPELNAYVYLLWVCMYECVCGVNVCRLFKTCSTCQHMYTIVNGFECCGCCCCFAMDGLLCRTLIECWIYCAFTVFETIVYMQRVRAYMCIACRAFVYTLHFCRRRRRDEAF